MSLLQGPDPQRLPQMPGVGCSEDQGRNTSLHCSLGNLSRKSLFWATCSA